MIETITLDTRKCHSPACKQRIPPLRRGERNNLLLTVKICEDRKPYDLTGKTASLVATTAAGASVGPYRLEIADEAAGVVRILLPSSLYSAIGTFTGYVEIREGESMVDTTDSFGGRVIDCIVPSSGEQVGAYANLGDYRSGEQASWTYPTQEGMAFAGWYRDAAFEEPCGVEDVDGFAYAKFVKVADLFQSMGCSLNMSGNVPAEYTTPRFSYTMSIPEGVAFIENGWYFKKVTDPTKPDVRSLSVNNIVQAGNKVFASLTFIKVPVRLYEKKFSTKAFVKYATADGTTVEAVEADYDAFRRGNQGRDSEGIVGKRHRDHEQVR
jgi:hypothetical protein